MTHLILTSSELRAIFRLLGECTELGADPVAWRVHLAARLQHVIQDAFVNIVESPRPTRPGEPPPVVALEYYTGGSIPNADDELIGQFMKSAGEHSLLVPAMMNEGKPVNTRLRRELLPEGIWYRSSYFHQYVRTLGLNDQMTSIDATAPNTVSSICLLTCAKEMFSERQSRILEVLHQELTLLKHAGKLAPLGGFSLWDLSPRQRDVLCGLFQGDSEAQLAKRLNISRHTAHDYIRALHRRFGVRSRGELMARCAKFYPVLERLQD